MPQAKSSLFEEFRTRLLELSYLESTLSVLGWDEQVYMPQKGALIRAKTTSYLAGLLHQKFTSGAFEKLLYRVQEASLAGKLNDQEKAIVREVWREFVREKKLPKKLVEELALLTSEAHTVWREARKKSDFKLFVPYLEKIFNLKQKEASLVGFTDSPYSALLDLYEPEAQTTSVAQILFDIRDFLVPFLKKIKGSKVKVDPRILRGNFPQARQEKFNREVARKIGFDFEAGRVDESTHPFTTGFHPHDVRITTRFDTRNLFYSLGSTIHEVGHALYEQGLASEFFGTPLAESISLGIHESQSRIWENQIGKGEPFWKFFYPALQKAFPKPFSKIALKDFYRAVNYVSPTLIRTESDEATYNLHIILRFEIEKGLLEGSLQVRDLPEIWNAKMKEYLGLDVTDAATGVLQDVHWSGGAIGYFPTYTLGNLYAAQFYKAAASDILNLEEEIAKGEFAHFLEWLRKNIHLHGKFYKAEELCRNLTGEGLNSKYFIDYITRKYSRIYQL